MQIIRQGVDPAQQSVQGSCNRCQTVVKFMPVEARYVSDQRDGDFYEVTCPTCGNKIYSNVYRGYNGPG